MTDIRLLFRQIQDSTRRDLNGGFIAKCSRGVSVSRYTTQPDYSDKGFLRWISRLLREVKGNRERGLGYGRLCFSLLATSIDL
jgi:hypothetical protein